MSLFTIKEKNELINDIEMEHFGCNTHWLGTTGINSCIASIILLNNNQNIFIEHRSDIYLPVEINLDNVRLWFENVAKHASTSVSGAKIT
jgi:hypothetical protein